MDKYVEFSLAKEILDTLFAMSMKNGFNPDDELYLQLKEDERKLNEYDRETIDKIMNEYAPLIKVGDNNG